MKKRALDAAQDNSAAGIERRARYAEASLKAEARIVAADVGGLMTVCALLGVTLEIAGENGITRDQFLTMLIDTLYRVSNAPPER